MLDKISGEELQTIDVVVGGTKRGVATVTKQFADLAGGVAVIYMDPALWDFYFADGASPALSSIHRPEVDFFQPVLRTTPAVPRSLLDPISVSRVLPVSLGEGPETLAAVAASGPTKRYMAAAAGLACGILAIALAASLGSRYGSHSRRHSRHQGNRQ